MASLMEFSKASEMETKSASKISCEKVYWMVVAWADGMEALVLRSADGSWVLSEERERDVGWMGG